MANTSTLLEHAGVRLTCIEERRITPGTGVRIRCPGNLHTAERREIMGTSRFGGYEDQPFLAELYDFVPGYVQRPDLDFYLGMCRSSPGKVLELGCGTGRVLIPAAREGCDIVGLDLSEHMLTECRKKLQAEPREVQERVTLVQGSMTDFIMGTTFALVTIPFRPFQHLISVPEQLACLRCINRHLDIRGKLVLDVFQVDLGKIADPWPQEEVEDVADIALPDGRRLRRTNRLVGLHRADQCMDVEIIFYLTETDGTTHRLVQAFPFRYFFRYEVEHLLARCGFRVVDLFGNFDGSPLTDESPEMIFMARKVQND